MTIIIVGLIFIFVTYLFISAWFFLCLMSECSDLKEDVKNQQKRHSWLLTLVLRGDKPEPKKEDNKDAN